MTRALPLMLLAMAAAGSTSCTQVVKKPEPAASVRMYAIDCGAIEYRDLAPMADDGHYDGRPGHLVVTCFLIQHPTRGWLLWDTGLPDLVHWFPWGMHEHNMVLRLQRRLVDHLADLGLVPDDITFVGISHLHFDHTGGAHDFPHATWIVPDAEVKWAMEPQTPEGVYLPSLDLIHKVQRINPTDGYDIFGDGSVKVISTPGHTPGHVSLLLNLRNAGPIIIAGDLWHLEESRRNRSVPRYNVDRQQTLESMDRLERLAASTHAKIIVGHDEGDIAALPAFPGYLD